jgi:hypothetical protein
MENNECGLMWPEQYGFFFCKIEVRVKISVEWQRRLKKCGDKSSKLPVIARAQAGEEDE